jgi:hypothetical protein
MDFLPAAPRPLGDDVNLYTDHVKVYIMGYQEFSPSAV